MNEKIEVEVIGFYQDGGDGGGTFRVYRNRDHYIAENTDRWTTAERAGIEWDKAEAGDNPYEDGELAKATIQLEKVGDSWQLAKSFYLHWGQ